MALVPALLAQGLLRAQTSKPSSGADGARLFAEAYANYAQTAQAGAFPVFLTGIEKELLRLALMPVFLAARTGDLSAYAAAWYQGLVQFWATPTFGIGTIAVPPLPTVIACLQGSMATTSSSAEASAQRHAMCLHAVTAAIVVFIPPATTVTLV